MVRFQENVISEIISQQELLQLTNNACLNCSSNLKDDKLCIWLETKGIANLKFDYMICIKCISSQYLEMMFKAGEYTLMVLTSRDWQEVMKGSKEEMIKTADHIQSLDSIVCDICGSKDARGWVCKTCENSKLDTKMILNKLFQNPLHPCLQRTVFICNNHFG